MLETHTIRVRVLLFAHLSDIRGRELSLDVPSGAAAGDVARELAATDERFAAALPSTRLALNGAWATNDTLLSDGDDLALIPPVSGG